MTGGAVMGGLACLMPGPFDRCALFWMPVLVPLAVIGAVLAPTLAAGPTSGVILVPLVPVRGAWTSQGG